MKNVCVIGTGYVGLVTGACLSTKGNRIYCVDNDEEKVRALNKGRIPIFEKGLEGIVKRGKASDRLHFTTDIEEALPKTDIVFIAVGTPEQEDGSANLAYVFDVANDIGRLLDHESIVVVKSTVPPGTTLQVKEAIRRGITNRGTDVPFHVAMNPETLREGMAVSDFMMPDRIILGVEDQFAAEGLKELYRPFTLKNDDHAFYIMSPTSAELAKYGSNIHLAARIAVQNELTRIAELTGANINDVRHAIGADRRIGTEFLHPGPGYGGSCFPKDTQAMEQLASAHQISTPIFAAITRSNDEQKRSVPQKVARHFQGELSGLAIAVWGLAFKKDTDDVRESPSVALISDLTQRGVDVCVYDPRAMQNFRSMFPELRIRYEENPYAAIKGVDALVHMTDWDELKDPDFEAMSLEMRQKILFDTRNQWRHYHETLERLGFTHYQTGAPTLIGK